MWNVLGESREHQRYVRPAATRSGGGVVPLADQQPVLLLAVEMGRHERPGPVEPRPVQPDGQPSVLLLLEQLVGAAVPDLDRARAVLPARDLALERRVLERMVLHVHGERPPPGSSGTPFGTAHEASAPSRSSRKS